jgi:hypothetical protein
MTMSATWMMMGTCLNDDERRMDNDGRPPERSWSFHRRTRVTASYPSRSPSTGRVRPSALVMKTIVVLLLLTAVPVFGQLDRTAGLIEELLFT